MGIAANNYIIIGTGVKFKESNSQGPVMFDSTVQTSGIRFSNGYTCFSDLRFTGGRLISSVGFKCGNNANMTISEIKLDELTYTVNATGGQTSISKVMLPTNKNPSSVKGATSWTFTKNFLTVNVLHGSSQEIIVGFYSTDTVSPEIFNATAILIALLPFLVLTMVISDIKEGSLGMGTIWKSVVLIAVFGAFAFMIRGWGY